MRFFRIYQKSKIKNKVVHLMMMEKFTEPMIRKMNALFPMSQNDFVIYGGPVHKGIELHCFREKNVWLVMNGFLFSQPKYRKFLLAHKKIIIHGLFEAGILHNWANDSELLKKTYVLLFGAYNNPLRMQDCEYNKVICSCAGVINLSRAENKIIEELYHPKGKLFDAFCVHIPLGEWRERQGNTIYVQIGNSASESMGHLALIKMLSKYKAENMKIYVPLSYGNSDFEYIDKVKNLGKEIFGDKFITIHEFMSSEEYNKFIADMDIALFGMKKQQAKGNIDLHLSAGNCVYLYGNSLIAEIYEQEEGCKIKHIEDIESMNFDEFIEWSSEDGKRNSLKVHNFYSNENFINKWKYILDYPMNV